MWSDYIPILLSVISQTAMPAAWKGKTMHHVQQSGLVFLPFVETGSVMIMNSSALFPSLLSKTSVK